MAANHLDACSKAAVACGTGFIDACLGGINLVMLSVFQGCEIGHEDIGPPLQTEFPAISFIDGRQGR